MGSKADFYLGRGLEAEWLGSVEWDGLPAALPASLLASPSAEQYRSEVLSMVDARADGIDPTDGWPWTWDTSHGTSYSYAFDQGRVWACCYGSSWWKATQPEPDHTTLTRKAAKFPDMSIYRDDISLFDQKEEKPKKRAKTGASTHS